MPELSASAVAALLAEYGQRLTLKGGNPYRAKAYRRAAENLLALPEPLSRLIAQNRLREVPGIGDAIAAMVSQLQKTGSHPALEKLRSEMPAGTLDLMTVPGLRPEKAIKLCQLRIIKH